MKKGSDCRWCPALFSSRWPASSPASSRSLVRTQVSPDPERRHSLERQRRRCSARRVHLTRQRPAPRVAALRHDARGHPQGRA